MFSYLYIVDNKLNWIGVAGAKVNIGDTGVVLTSVTNGLFGADNIPTGVHGLVGIVYRGVVWDYHGYSSILIARQQISEVELFLYPESGHSYGKVMYGILYEDKAKTIPLSNVRLHLRPWPYGRDTPQSGDCETTTSFDGSYGFSDILNWPRYSIVIDGIDGGGDLLNFGRDDYEFRVDDSSLGVVNLDGYLNP